LLTTIDLPAPRVGTDGVEIARGAPSEKLLGAPIQVIETKGGGV